MKSSLTIYFQSPKDIQKIYHTPMSVVCGLESMELWSNLGNRYDDISGGVDYLTDIRTLGNPVNTGFLEDHWTYKIVGIADNMMFIASGVCEDEPKAINAINYMCRLRPTNVWVKYGDVTACCDVATMFSNLVSGGQIVQTPATLTSGSLDRFCGNDMVSEEPTREGQLIPTKYTSPYFASRDAYSMIDYASLTFTSMHEANNDLEFRRSIENFERIQSELIGDDAAIIRGCLDSIFFSTGATVGDVKSRFPHMQEVEILIPRTPQYDARGMADSPTSIAESTIAYTLPYIMASCAIVDISFRYVSSERNKKLTCPYYLHFIHTDNPNASVEELSAIWEIFQRTYDLVLASYVVGQVGEHDVTVVSGIGTYTSVNITTHDISNEPGFVEFDNHISSNHSPAITNLDNHSSSQYNLQSIIDIGMYRESQGDVDDVQTMW